jgi:DNA-binding beta-propeller fold protein YncE
VTVLEHSTIAVPGPISFVSDGDTLWLATSDGDRVVPFDPASGAIVESDADVPLIGDPMGIAFSDGFLWEAAIDSVMRVDPSNPEIFPINVDGTPLSVEIGAVIIWVTPAERGVARINPTSAEVEGYASVSRPWGISVSDGAVWVSQRDADDPSADGTVVRIDPRTLDPDNPIGVGSGPGAVALADDVLWVANRLGNTVSRIDLSSGDGDYQATNYEVCSEPADIYVDGDRVWVLCAGGVEGEPGQLVLIDADTVEELDRVQVPGRPESFIAHGGSLWVAVHDNDEVWRFDLGTDAESAAPSVSTDTLPAIVGTDVTVAPTAPATYP